MKKNKEFIKVDKQRKNINNLSSKNRILRAEKLVSEDCLTEYQGLNYKQARKIKKQKTELQYIKYRLSEELYRFASELELLKKDRAQLEENYSDKIDNLKVHISLKSNEVKNLRFLAKTILYQKTELDKFFLETIDYVKNELKQENGKSGMGSRQKAMLNRKGASRNKMLNFNLELERTAMQKKEPRDLSKKVDLSELDWSDREKIVRILYTKISMGVTPSYWRQIERLAQEREEAAMANMNETNQQQV